MVSATSVISVWSYFFKSFVFAFGIEKEHWYLSSLSLWLWGGNSGGPNWPRRHSDRRALPQTKQLIYKTFRNETSLKMNEDPEKASGTSSVPVQYALQMKRRWEFNIKVWFPFMYSQKWNCAASLFPKQSLPIPTLTYLWEIYIFPGSVCLFCCSQICGPILGIYKLLTDTWMWKLGLRPRNSQKRNTLMGFSLQCDSEQNTDIANNHLQISNKT